MRPGRRPTHDIPRYVAVLPVRNAADALDAFAGVGAAVLHGHMRWNVAIGPLLALHRVNMVLLRTHYTYNKQWKCVVPLAKPPAHAEHVVEHLVKHIVDQTHDSDKKRMEVFATHAMFDAVFQRGEDGSGPQAVDARMVAKF